MTILLFDGVCNLCNGAVQFVLKHNTDETIKFAALQSEAGQQLLKAHHLPTETLNSLVLIEDGRAYTESTGALRLARHFGGFWRVLYIMVYVPAPLRDVVYRWVGANRYRWFGQAEACMIPTPALKARFL
jgi:predicted DCC family thiol-disulfide oxidoreductase YuxK